MPESLGNPEKAALIALLLAGGEVVTPDLKKHYGVELRMATRERLNRDGLIISVTDKRPHRHRITSPGVAECERVLASGERPATGLLGVVFELFVPVVAYLRQRDVRLADVILESSIRVAYDELSTQPQDFVRLAKLRPKLNGADRVAVDRVLESMTRTGFVHLTPSSNRKGLTDEDHAAAIRIGSEDKHLVAIEES